MDDVPTRRRKGLFVDPDGDGDVNADAVFVFVFVLLLSFGEVVSPVSSGMDDCVPYIRSDKDAIIYINYSFSSKILV